MTEHMLLLFTCGIIRPDVYKVSMMQTKSIMNYCNKLILAPMVRGSLLPQRLLALRYGADLVYTDEIIDYSMLLTTRRVNNVLGTVDFVNLANAYLVFRTCPLEKENLIFQIGTANADRAIKVAKMVQNDVSGIDINMGCPKSFSTSLGIGAALLTNVDNAKRIVQGLVENVQLPITCKIRISDDINTTIAMVKDFESLGVSAIAVHGRTRNQWSGEPVNKDAIRTIAESVKIPIIANGGSLDIQDFSEVMRFKEDCGAASVMVARAAQKNVSIFRKEGKIPADDLITEYLKLCVEFDHSFENAKYSIRKMDRSLDVNDKSPTRRAVEATQSLEHICNIWNLGDYYREKQSEYQAKGLQSLGVSPPSGNKTPNETLVSREKKFKDKNIISECIQYRRKFFDSDMLPKSVLLEYCRRNKLPPPTYESTRIDRQFCGIATVQDKQYGTVFWHKTKPHAEQAAALACCLHLRLYDENFLVSVGCIQKS